MLKRWALAGLVVLTAAAFPAGPHGARSRTCGRNRRRADGAVRSHRAVGLVHVQPRPPQQPVLSARRDQYLERRPSDREMVGSESATKRTSIRSRRSSSTASCTSTPGRSSTPSTPRPGNSSGRPRSSRRSQAAVAVPRTATVASTRTAARLSTRSTRRPAPSSSRSATRGVCRSRTRPSSSRSCQHDATGYSVATAPAYHNGTLYFGLALSENHIPGGLVVAVDGKTGAVKWVFKTIPQGPQDDGWEVAKDTWRGGTTGGWRDLDDAGDRQRARAPVRQRRQSVARLRRLGTQRDQSLHQFDRRPAPADRQAGVVLPDHPSRHLGLGSRDRPGAVRRHHRRPDGQGRGVRRQELPDVHVESGDRAAAPPDGRDGRARPRPTCPARNRGRRSRFRTRRRACRCSRSARRIRSSRTRSSRSRRGRCTSRTRSRNSSSSRTADRASARRRSARKPVCCT